MNKEILRLAIPNIISNLSVPLLSFVDVALMGHLESAEYILTIGFGVMIFNFIFWGFGFLRMGTSGFAAQEFGRDNHKECLFVLYRALLIALAGAVFLIIFKGYLLRLSLLFIDTTPEVELYIADYFNIRILSAPATITIFAFTGWFFGMQNARIPMIIAIVVNLLNIGFDVWFVKFANMDSRGAALGTLISQYCGLLLAVILFYRCYGYIHCRYEKKALFNVEKMKKFICVNSDIFLRTVCLIVTFSFFKIQSGKQGIILGSANIILFEFFTIIAYGVDGFSYAAESVVGKYFGAGDRENYKKAIKRFFQWGVGFGAVMVLAFYMFGMDMVQMLTDNKAVVEAARPYICWVIVAPVINAVPFIWDGVFIAITASKEMRNMMLISTFLIFFPTFYIFRNVAGNHALWLALILFMMARGVSQTVVFKRISLDA